MGRFVKNSQGQLVYVPTYHGEAGPLNPRPLDDLPGLVSPISGAGAGVPDIEVQQPIFWNEEKMRLENLLLDEEQTRQVKEFERERQRQRREQEIPRPREEDPRRLMEIPTQGSAWDQIQQQLVRQQREAAARESLAQQSQRQRERQEKRQVNKSRAQRILNSPEAREWARKIDLMIDNATLEDFKTWWVSQQDPQNAHAWDNSIEGKAFDRLIQQESRKYLMSIEAGRMSGKLHPERGYPVKDHETVDEAIQQIHQEHDKRELERELRKESQPLFYDPFNQFEDTSIKKISRDIYTPREFNPLSIEVQKATLDRVQAIGMAKQVESRVAEIEQTIQGLAEIELEDTALRRDDSPFLSHSPKFGTGSMSVTDARAEKGELENSLNQQKREFMKLQEEILNVHLNDENISDANKQIFVNLLAVAGSRIQKADVENRYELRLNEKLDTLNKGDYWKNLERRKGKPLNREERLQYLRDTETPMDLYLEEKNQQNLEKFRRANALKSIQEGIRSAIPWHLDPLGAMSSDTSMQIVTGIADGLAGLLKTPVGIGAAVGVPGFSTASNEISDFLSDHAEAVEIYTKRTLGDGHSLKTLGLTPSQFRGMVTSIYQSMVLGGFGLQTKGMGVGFGLTTFSDEYQNAMDVGLTRGTAIFYASIQGGAEGLFEAALPGTNKWVTHFVKKNTLNKAASEGLKIVMPTFKARVKDALYTMGEEQLSEALTTLVQTWAEGSFIHEDKGFFSKNIGKAFLETAETVFAQTLLMGGGGNLMSGRGRRLKHKYNERMWRHQQRLDAVYKKMEGLKTSVRSSGAVSGRIAEAINRISPFGAAHIRRMRERGEKISRKTIEKLYGPEIASVLGRADQREKFADALLGQKKKSQKEAIDNSPVMEKPPAKVVEVENQQTGERSVVNVSVEEGQTTQEAVNEKIRTPTGESPVVVNEPATESPSQSDEWIHYEDTGEVLPQAIDRIANKVATGQKLTPEEDEMRGAAEEEIDARVLEIEPAPATPETSTEAPAEAPAEEVTVPPSLSDWKEVEDLGSAVDPDIRQRIDALPEVISWSHQELVDNIRNNIGEEAANAAEAYIQARSDLAIKEYQRKKGTAPAETPAEDAKQKKRASRAFRDSDSKIQQAREDNDPVALATAAHQLRERGKKFGDDSRVQEADELIAELEAQGYKIHDPAGEIYVTGRLDVEAIAWVEQEGIENETIVEVRRPAIYGPDGKVVQAAQVVIASPAEATTEAAAEAQEPLPDTPQGETVGSDARAWTPEQEKEKTDHALGVASKRAGKKVKPVKPKSETGRRIQKFAESLGIKLIFLKDSDMPGAGGISVRKDGEQTGVIFLRQSLEGKGLLRIAAHEIAHGIGADKVDIGLTKKEKDELIEEYLSRGTAEQRAEFEALFEARPESAEREAIAVLAEKLIRDGSFRNRMLQENPSVVAKIVEAIKKFLSRHPEVQLSSSEAKLMSLFDERLAEAPTESAPETASEFSPEGKLPADAAKELGDLIESATTEQDKKGVLNQWNRFNVGAKQSIFASFTESQKQQLYEIELDAKTIPQLKAQLKEMGVKGYSGKNKAGLIEMILERTVPRGPHAQMPIERDVDLSPAEGPIDVSDINVSTPEQRADESVKMEIADRINAGVVYRGAREGNPQKLYSGKGNFFISSESFASTYGKTAAWNVTIENPLIVSEQEWMAFQRNPESLNELFEDNQDRALMAEQTGEEYNPIDSVVYVASNKQVAVYIPPSNQTNQPSPKLDKSEKREIPVKSFRMIDLDRITKSQMAELEATGRVEFEGDVIVGKPPSQMKSMWETLTATSTEDDVDLSPAEDPRGKLKDFPLKGKRRRFEEFFEVDTKTDIGGLVSKSDLEDAPTARFGIDELIARERIVRPSTIRRMLSQRESTGTPIVVQKNGKLYLLDGNHTALFNKLSGNATVEAKFINRDTPTDDDVDLSPAESDESVVSLKNASVNADFIAAGLAPPTKAAQMDFQNEIDEAAKYDESDIQDTIESYINNPRPPSVRDEAVILLYYQRLRDNPDASLDRLEEVGQLIDFLGTESARSLAFRRMWLSQDYTLDGMKRQMETVLKGKERLSEKETAEMERKAAEYKKRKERAEKLQKTKRNIESNARFEDTVDDIADANKTGKKKTKSRKKKPKQKDLSVTVDGQELNKERLMGLSKEELLDIAAKLLPENYTKVENESWRAEYLSTYSKQDFVREILSTAEATEQSEAQAEGADIPFTVQREIDDIVAMLGDEDFMLSPAKDNSQVLAEKLAGAIQNLSETKGISTEAASKIVIDSVLASADQSKHAGIKKAHAKAKKILKEVGKKEEIVPEELTNEQLVEKLKNNLSKIVKANEQEKINKNKKTAYHKIARQLLEHFVGTERQDAEQALNSIYEVFEDALPGEFTKDRVRELACDYGIHQSLSKDETKVRIRNARGLLRQLSKIHDMREKGQQPKKSGVEQHTPDYEERQLIKIVNRLKKNLDLNDIDPEKSAKTALESLKTRLRNEIEEIENALDNNNPLNKERTPVERDAEAKELEKKKKELIELYNEAFPKEIDEKAERERRLVNRIKHEDKRIEELEQAIEKNQPIERSKESPPMSEELAKRQEKRRKLVEKYNELFPPPKVELTAQQKLERREQAAERTINALRNALQNGERIKRSEVDETMVSAALREMQAEIKMLREEYNRRFPPVKRKTDRAKQEAARIKAAEESIAAMEEALRTGRPIPKAPKMATSPVLEKIIQRRERIRREYRKRFPRKPRAVTEEQRIASAEAALRKSIQRVKRRIRTKDISPLVRVFVRTPLLDSLRAEKELLDKELREMRRLATALSPKEKAKRRRMAALLTKKKQMKADLIAGQRTKRKNSPEYDKTDKDIIALENEIADITRDYVETFGLDMAVDRTVTGILRQIKEYRNRIAEGRITADRRSNKEVEAHKNVVQARKDLLDAQRDFARFKEDVLWKRMNVVEKVARVTADTWDGLKTLKASYDFSGFRQALTASLARPLLAIKAGSKMFQAVVSEEKRLEIEDQLANDKYYSEAKAAGISFNQRNGVLSAQEEGYMSRWIDRYSDEGFGTWKGAAVSGLAASERAFSTLLNTMRMEYYKDLTVGQDLSAEEKKHLAGFVNAMTGRGGLGKSDMMLVGVNRIFWAPRLLVSRAQILSFHHMGAGLAFGKSKDFRKGKMAAIVGKEYVRMLRPLLAIAALAWMSMDDDEWDEFTDPRSPKFGCIKIGGVYLDWMGGFKPVIRFAAQNITGSTVTFAGKEKEFGDDIFTTRGTVFMNFLRTKLHPSLGLAVSVVEGSDLVGRPMTPTRTAFEAVAPLWPASIAAGMASEFKKEGVSAMGARALIELPGMFLTNTMAPDELSNYESIFGEIPDPNKKSPAQKIRDKIKQKARPKTATPESIRKKAMPK